MSEDMPLNTPEASKYLWNRWHYKRSPHTLETYWSRGGGLEFFKIVPDALYWPDDLDAWVQSRMTPKLSNVSEGRRIRLVRNNLSRGRK